MGAEGFGGFLEGGVEGGAVLGEGGGGHDDFLEPLAKKKKKKVCRRSSPPWVDSHMRRVAAEPFSHLFRMPLLK